MPAGDQVAMPRWVPIGIHMHHDTCGCRWEPSEALPPGPRQASICSMHGTVKTLSDLLHLHCGTASQIISGLRHIGIKRRTVYRSEQEPTWQVPLWTLVQDPHTDAPT
jgi:hypothetical protein